jgi:hypothetical protein
MRASKVGGRAMENRIAIRRGQMKGRHFLTCQSGVDASENRRSKEGMRKIPVWTMKINRGMIVLIRSSPIVGRIAIRPGRPKPPQGQVQASASSIIRGS